jgi:hypothetical protein
MKDGVTKIVGKTINGLVIAEGSRRQVFLLFEDDTHFEFYGDSFTGAGGIDPGGLEKVRSYCAKCGSKITMEIIPPIQVASGAASKMKPLNDFSRYCVLLVFFECVIGTLDLVLDHQSAGGFALAGMLAAVCYYILRYQISRF